MTNFSTEVQTLISRYAADADVAFFVMLFEEGEGIVWPPPEGQFETVLRQGVDGLRMVYVNRQYLNIYGFPATETPIGWKMSDLTGSRTSAFGVLAQFYERGGHSEVMMVRPRMDGHIMTVHGEYRALYANGRIIGHCGLERDITVDMVALPDDMEN